ncbi:hypothetical protein BKA70DRAFT_1397349 [Coprinopsis sp. MPI-PUGE-AT-0042]|nr:hypothetical protein BKA70DRAFT_1397349 [Coprinopsis sp. MPI-PUGE-AT-0042]
MQNLLASSAEEPVDLTDREIQSIIQKCIVAVSSGLLYYDYFLTLPREVAWVWQAPRKCSWMTIIFYINRYLLLVGQPIVLFRSFWPSSDLDRLPVCVALGLFRQYFAIIVQVVVAVFMILRTYALYNFDRRVLAFFILAMMATTGNAISSVMMSDRTDFSPKDLTACGCILPFPDTNAHRVASAWIGLLAFDAVTFLFTLRKSLKEPSLGGSTIMRVLLRDGAIYFGIMTALTVGTVASYFSDNVGISMTQATLLLTVTQPYRRGNTSPLTNVVSSCLVSRLILNLRDPCLSSRFTPRSVQGTRDVLSTVRWEGPGEGDQGGANCSARPPPEDGEKIEAEDRRYSDRSKAGSEEGLLKKYKQKDPLVDAA